MEFRPCIDIHNGKVKQIVGSSLRDENNQAKENFVSQVSSEYYAKLYMENNLKGGHIILLNAVDSEYYQATKDEAIRALKAFPQGMQIGGGIIAENAKEFIEAGASHCIVTSYVFKDGQIYYDRLKKIVEEIGSEHLVLDLSCKKCADGNYYVVTDRWQKLTREMVNLELLDLLSNYCDEFLIHAVDVEGKNSGIEEDLVKMLAGWDKRAITYAGGVHDYKDIDKIGLLTNGKMNVTIGSALDLFGGNLEFKKAIDTCDKWSVKK